ncbi:MAG: DivIVA domain-containing protein [Solirubrobacteraceae bacterium]|nr:DivIVA domain-containing protein [Solirubrobacteraceae bacterium]
MTLDRQSIEKRDFPIARRGYDPAGVDAHLARIADDLDQLRRESDRAATGGVAGSASTHVQAIVEAAESTAERLLREAQTEAAELRERAAGDAQRARQEALEESREHVAKVGEQTTRMLQRVEAMDTELGGMIESLRTGVNRLVADLALLEGNIADLHEQHGGVAPVSAPVLSKRIDEPTPGPATDAEVVATETDPELDPSDVQPIIDGADEPAFVSLDDEPAELADGDSERDQEASARLIALDLALGGSDRDQIKEELEALFSLADVDRLLDDVFTSIDA